MKEKVEREFQKVRQCRLCANILPLEPRPIIQGNGRSKILIVSQAPGLAAHNTHIPWNDASGDRLRAWLGMDKAAFYNEDLLAILPMSFCYPGKSASGDLPPVKACAPTWHAHLMNLLPTQIRILIGKHAQDYYLQDKRTLTQRVMYWRDYQPNYFVLPHPSPRNNIWLKKNPWFEQDTLPELRAEIQSACQLL